MYEYTVFFKDGGTMSIAADTHTRSDDGVIRFYVEKELVAEVQVSEVTALQKDKKEDS